MLLVNIFVAFAISLIFYRNQIDGKNISFVPEQIDLQVKDLPVPYATQSFTKGPRVVSVPNDPQLYVPKGFTVKVFYNKDIRMPRILLYTPTGDLLVSEPDANRISVLVDNDGDGYPDERQTFADASNGLNRPYGMAFANGFIYVGSENATRRYSWIRGARQIVGTGELVMEYGSAGHWTRTVLPSPDFQKLFIGIGSATNVDIEELPRASVQVMNLDGSHRTTYAYGLRNPIGLAFHPITKDLYVATQERDLLGDDLVPDYFTRIEQDDFYGWPYAYMTPNLTDPRHRFANGSSIAPDLVARTRTPDVLFQAHSAVLDTIFYTGEQFPERYRNGAFAAFHGSWNRDMGTGYKIVFIPFNQTNNRPLGYYEDFVTGFLVNPQGPDTFGRPVGLLVLNDGSLLFTEDGNDYIYQVQYQSDNPNQASYSNINLSILIFSIFIFILNKVI